MKSWKEKVERWFAAVAFAEAGEPQMAMEMAGTGAALRKVSLEDTFAAVAFAEAGCQESARELMGMAPEGRSARGFLSVVGLRGVRVRYGLAQVAGSLDFASAVGLQGVRVWYGVAELPG